MYLGPRPKPGELFIPEKIVSKALRDFARGQSCTLRMPWCNGDPETTVLCHCRMKGTGMATKPHDIWGYHGCSECHRREQEAGYDDLLRAIFETQCRALAAGLIVVPR